MNKIYVPTTHSHKWQTVLDDGGYVVASHADDWKQLLKSPQKHWKIGASARTLAHCWQDADGDFPPEIKVILSPVFPTATPVLIFPEHSTSMPTKGNQSQSDIFVLGQTDDGLLSITIEGKVSETFQSRLGSWKKGMSDNKRARLDIFLHALGLHHDPPDTIYYQLIHRTASAMLEAKYYGASSAVMIVHSFSPENKHINAYHDFLSLFNRQASIGELVKLNEVDNITLYVGWAHGNENYLAY